MKNAEEQEQIIKLWEAVFHRYFTDESNFQIALKEDKSDFAPQMASFLEKRPWLASKGESNYRRGLKTTSTKPIKMNYKTILKSQQSSEYQGSSSQVGDDESSHESSERPLKKAKRV